MTIEELSKQSDEELLRLCVNLSGCESIHDAENTLTVGQHLNVDQILTEMCGTLDYSATERQRRIAFISTKQEVEG